MDTSISAETLAIIIAAKDEASASLARIGTELDALNAKAKESVVAQDASSASLANFGSNAEKVGRGLSTYVTLPIVGIAAASMKMAMTFQQSMTYIRTDAGDMTDNINQMSNAVLNLARQSQFSPDQLANGLYHLASLGLRGAEAINALNTAQKMAAVGGADLESTTSALGAAIVTGIKGVQDYNTAAGVLDATIGAGNMRMNDMVDALGTGVLPVFKNAGLSIVDFGAALATLTDNGVDAAMAATRLRMTIALMEAPSKGAVTALEKIGMTSTQLGLDMQTKGLIPALTDLRNHLLATYGTSAQGSVEMEAALTRIFGGGRSSAAVQTLIDQLGRMQTKFDQISKQSSEFSQKYAEQQQTASAKIKTAWSGIQADAIQLGGDLLPTLTSAFSKIANAITEVVVRFQMLDPANKKLVEGFFEILAVVGPVLFIFGKIIKIGKDIKAMFVEDLIPAISYAIGSFSSLWTVIMGGSLAADAVNPIFAIITVIALLALAVYEIVTHWSTVETWIKNFWDRNQKYILLFLAVFMPGIFFIATSVDLIVKYWSPISDFFKALWDDIKHTFDAVVGWFKLLWDDPWKAFKQFVSNLSQWDKDVVDAIWAGLQALGDQLENAGQWIWKEIKKGWDSVVDEAKKLPQQTLDLILRGLVDEAKGYEAIGSWIYNHAKKGWDEAVKDAKTWSNDIWKGIQSGLATAEAEAKSVASTVWSKINGAWKTVSRDSVQWGKDLVSNIAKGVTVASPSDNSQAGGVTDKIFKALGLDNIHGGILGGLVGGAKTLTQFDIGSLIDWKQQAVKIYQQAFNLGKTVVGDIEAGFKQSVKDTKQWAKDIYNGVKQGWDEAWKDAKQWGKDAYKAVKNGWDIAWKDIKQWGKDIYNGIKGGWDQSWKDAKQWAKNAYNDIKAGWDDAWKDVKQWGKDIIGGSKGVVQGMKDGVKDIVKFFKDLPTNIYKDVFDSGSKTADNHQSGVKSSWTNVDKMKNLGDAILKGFGIAVAAVIGAIILLAVSVGIALINGAIKGISAAMGALNTAVGWIEQHVRSAVSGAGTWLIQTGKDIITGLIHGIDSVIGSVGSHLKSIGKDVAHDVGGALHAAHIPGFASGVQNFIGGYAMLGENGPELAYLPNGSNVYSAGQTQSMLNNTTNNKTVHIGQVVLNTPAAVNEFFKKIDQDDILVGMGLTPNRGLR